jgi:hypothetical protein
VRDVEDTNAVYRAILADGFTERRPVIVIDNKFSRYSAEGQLEELHKLESLTRTDGLEAATLQDFFYKNKERVSTERVYLTGYVGIPFEELQSIFEHYGMNGWTQMRQRYSNSHGVLTLSRVGFNKEHTQAFVCVGFATDFTAGSGGYLLLQRTGGQWTMKEVGDVWVS